MLDPVLQALVRTINDTDATCEMVIYTAGGSLAGLAISVDTYAGESMDGIRGRFDIHAAGDRAYELFRTLRDDPIAPRFLHMRGVRRSADEPAAFIRIALDDITAWSVLAERD